MKVLLTGAHGQLGKALSAAIPDERNVACVGRAEHNLADPDAVYARGRAGACDLVLNAAAYTAVDKAEVEEALADAVNAQSVDGMARALGESGGRLVHVSADFVFDGSSARAYRPEDPRNPISAYGRTKAAGEIAAGEGGRTSYGPCCASYVSATNCVWWLTRSVPRRMRPVSLRPSSVWSMRRRAASSITAMPRLPASPISQSPSMRRRALGLLTREVKIVPIPSSAYPTPAARPVFSRLDSSARRAMRGDQPPHWRENLHIMLEEEKAFG